jgi:hypothetical protein
MSWNNRLNKAYNSRIKKLTATILKAALTAATNGLAQTIALGPVPAGAVLMSVAVRLNAQFTGGGATSVGMTIGDGVSATHIATNFDVLGGTVTTSFVKPTAGTVAGPYVAADTINLIFTPDGAHQLVNLTTGSIDVEVDYFVADSP